MGKLSLLASKTMEVLEANILILMLRKAVPYHGAHYSKTLSINPSPFKFLRNKRFCQEPHPQDSLIQYRDSNVIWLIYNALGYYIL